MHRGRLSPLTICRPDICFVPLPFDCIDCVPKLPTLKSCFLLILKRQSTSVFSGPAFDRCIRGDRCDLDEDGFVLVIWVGSLYAQVGGIALEVAVRWFLDNRPFSGIDAESVRDYRGFAGSDLARCATVYIRNIAWSIYQEGSDPGLIKVHNGPAFAIFEALILFN